METVPVIPLPENDRSSKLCEAFFLRFEQNPVFYVRVPGRVNLIGEHIDYCGYGVCPMALEQDILLAVSVSNNNSILKLTNVDSNFPDYECCLNSIVIDVAENGPQWYQYFLCGVKGLLTLLPKKAEIKGFNVMVCGSIPKSAGLSSSSALVSAAALATAHVHNFSISKEKIANLCAECERYIGTQGGGMDQAIAFLATQGCAKLIEFSPLRSKDLLLPPEAQFVIAHSLTNLNKAATADFNCRVVECRLAAQKFLEKYLKTLNVLEKVLLLSMECSRIILNTNAEHVKISLLKFIADLRYIVFCIPFFRVELEFRRVNNVLQKFNSNKFYDGLKIIAKHKGLDWTAVKKLGELQEKLGCCLKTMITLVKDVLHEEPYSKNDILTELETNLENLEQTSLTYNTKHIKNFKLHQRALHVFEEALRVQQFHEICNNASLEGDALKKLGILMSQSHDSLRDLYECSHTQLDKLVELSSKLTLGARLTGAGWGGCAVALVEPEKVENYISFLKDNFYKDLNISNCENLVFATSPNSGACIYTPITLT